MIMNMIGLPADIGLVCGLEGRRRVPSSAAVESGTEAGTSAAWLVNAEGGASTGCAVATCGLVKVLASTAMVTSIGERSGRLPRMHDSAIAIKASARSKAS